MIIELLRDHILFILIYVFIIAVLNNKDYNNHRALVQWNSSFRGLASVFSHDHMREQQQC